MLFSLIFCSYLSQLIITSESQSSVICCLFSSICTSGDGGAICLKNPQISFTGQNCVFANCSATQNGGGIYCEPKDFGLTYCIAEHCVSFIASFCFVLSPSTCSVLFEQVMVSYSSPDIKTVRYRSVHFDNGKQSIRFTNHTNNNADKVSGYVLLNAQSFIVSYCHFMNNYATNWCLFDTQTGVSTLYFTMSNYINNTMSSDRFGLIYFYCSNAEISNSFFSRSNSYLFYVYSNSLIVSNCTIHHYGNIYYGNIASSNIKIMSEISFPMHQIEGFKIGCLDTQPTLQEMRIPKIAILVFLLNIFS